MPKLSVSASYLNYQNKAVGNGYWLLSNQLFDGGGGGDFVGGNNESVEQGRGAL
jgi:hypothetical protein